MKFVARAALLCLVASLAFLATSASAAAAPKRITGQLSKSGYTVIALAANGEAKVVRASRGKFKLRPPSARVTLHLRAPNGTYAGPLVVGRAGKRAIVGLRAGARLGRVSVRRGHAKVGRRLPKRWVDASRTARARRGVPIGAGVFGRVRSRPPRRSIPGDPDLDGVPNPLDIDDDGDLILDSVDRSTAARAAQAGHEFNPNTRLDVSVPETRNVNAPGSTAEQIAAARDGRLLIMHGAWHNVGPPAGVELDCGTPPPPESGRQPGPSGGLIYCSRGGTGRAGGQPFPGEPGGLFDGDGDGFGTVIADPRPDGSGPGNGMSLLHGATPDQIGTGDLLILQVPTGGVETLFPATLRFVFATAPALVSYDDDGPGGSDPTPVPYPVAPPTQPNGPAEPGTPGGPGVMGNGFPVKARLPGDPEAGDVVLTLTFWRPQRRPIPPETGWIDLGGLNYFAAKSGGGVGPCPQSAYSENDPELTPATGLVGEQFTKLVDQAPDRPASRANTFTYTLNLTRCVAQDGLSFNPGEERGIGFRAQAPNSLDDASQDVWFKRQ